MKIPVAHSPIRGQTSLEYLLLLAVVAVIIIASFGPGSLVSQVHDSAQDYYNTVTRVIMGKTLSPSTEDGVRSLVRLPVALALRSCSPPANARRRPLGGHIVQEAVRHPVVESSLAGRVQPAKFAAPRGYAVVPMA